MRGAFDIKALNETAFALSFYAFGIPFFATVKILTSGFQSQKKMKLPVRISIICICVNVVLNLILMQYFRQGGIALATVIASLLNNSISFYFLNRELKHLKLSPILYSGFKSIVSALIAGWVALLIYQHLLNGLSLLVTIIILFSAFCLSFTLSSALLKSEELNDWLKIVLKDNKRT
jgi:putative peptidoglycan lipid II flippase